MALGSLVIRDIRLSNDFILTLLAQDLENSIHRQGKVSQPLDHMDSIRHLSDEFLISRYDRDFQLPTKGYRTPIVGRDIMGYSNAKGIFHKIGCGENVKCQVF